MTHNCLYQVDMDLNWGPSLSAKSARSLHQSKPSLLIDEMEILAIILQVHFEDWKKYLAWYLVQCGLQSFLAQRTGFMEDNFSTEGGCSGWFKYITFIVDSSYHYYLSSTSDHQTLDPRCGPLGWRPLLVVQ